MPTDPVGGGLPEGVIDGRSSFETTVRAALAVAAEKGWREIVFSDPDFVDWPLGERATLDALQAWSAGGRSFTMLATRFDAFERTHARFVLWRRMWSHIIDCRACSGPGAPTVPSGIWTPTWFAHRLDPERDRGVCGVDPVHRQRLREMIDEALRRGRPGFPASTLGL